MHKIQHLFHIKDSVSEVFKAISTHEGITAWYSQTEPFEAHKGATFEMIFGEIRFKFEITELIPNACIAWTCVESAMPIEGHVMSYHLDENEGKTRVRYTHEGFDNADDFMANMNFSSAKYLESLRQFCQTGQGEAFGSERYRI